MNAEYQRILTINSVVEWWLANGTSARCSIGRAVDIEYYILSGTQTDSDISFSSDLTHISANSGRYYIAAVSPVFFTVRWVLYSISTLRSQISLVSALWTQFI